MDFGKFKFDEAQRAKESRRKATSSSIKEMKYRPKIGVGDFDTKTRQVTKFLGEGHKVKITIMFRGREMSHPELGKKLLDHVAEQVGSIAKIEAAPKLDGRNMIMVLAPDRRGGPTATAPAATAPARPATRSAARPTSTAGAAPATSEAPPAATLTEVPSTTTPPRPPPPPAPATAPAAAAPAPPPAPAPAAAPAPLAESSDATASPRPNWRVPATPAPTLGAATAPSSAEET
jgi:translation initiation factor IF-3